MIIEQLYTGCLAEAAYYIESNGEVAIIDPLRETSQYVEKAKQNGAEIKYILETHFHADFVSGHVDLAKKTGAEIVFGPTAKTEFAIHTATDGEELKLGNVTIQVIHTPGHTLESTCYLLKDENGKEVALFSGDTLFIGDVGRPDLAVKSDLSKEDLAKMLFDSLRNRVMTLPDDIIVYPGHGAGSACGKNLSSETFDTLGNQKLTNYALRADMTKEEFVKEVTEGILPPPQYFPKNAMMNKSGYAEFDDVMSAGNRAWSADEFERIANEHHALILDTRSKEDYAKEHIPGSIFIGLDGGFAPWVGALIVDIHQPILFIAPGGQEEEVITRLSRVGYDATLGYLKGGIEAWKQAGKEIDEVVGISATDLALKMKSNELSVVDVRKQGEYDSEHVHNAANIPLDYINSNMDKLDKNSTLFLHCKSGYRSLIFASIMKSRGMHDVVNVEGGFEALKETDIPKSAYVCPSEL
ncbi:MAG: MBL fold metallo-hydrolase [Flavobacteriales bacterium]|nr:MBL fold metallo-hydrolase [Flavobacteriales bacterium]